jgi:hypothetical protein
MPSSKVALIIGAGDATGGAITKRCAAWTVEPDLQPPMETW